MEPTSLEQYIKKKIKDNFSKVTEIMSDVMFYGSIEIASMCQEYQAFWNEESRKGFTVDDFAQLDQKLMVVVNAMKNELGLDSL